ncbi:MAG: hypothetical protein ACON30_03310 [Flavobacteriaceae bacterium]
MILRAALFLILSYSCGLPKDTPPVSVSYDIIGPELLKNSRFIKWDTNVKPKNWNINEALDHPENSLILREKVDFLLRKEGRAKVFITQEVNLDPMSFYSFEAAIETKLKHNTNAVLKITHENGDILGLRKLEFKDNRRYKTIFRTDYNTNVLCALGFIENGTGDIMIKAISLKKVGLKQNKFESKIANYWTNRLALDFSESENFDTNIYQITSKLSKLLLAEKLDDLELLTERDHFFTKLPEESYLKKVLSESALRATKSFATKLVLGTKQILNNFNIGTRVLEFRKEGKRTHMALQYYNPYSKCWKMIDPMYNFSIARLENLNHIQQDEMLSKDLGGLIPSNKKALIEIYNSSQNIIVSKELYLGYPF